MEDLKEFLDKQFDEYDLVEDERGTRVEFHLGGRINLLFERGNRYLGSYFDREEGQVLHVFAEED